MGSRERGRQGFAFDYTAQNEHGDAKKRRWKDAGGLERNGKGDGRSIESSLHSAKEPPDETTRSGSAGQGQASD